MEFNVGDIVSYPKAYHDMHRGELRITALPNGGKNFSVVQNIPNGHPFMLPAYAMELIRRGNTMKFAKGDRFQVEKAIGCQMDYQIGDIIVITMVSKNDEYPYYRNERTDSSCSGHTDAFTNGSLIKISGDTTMEQTTQPSQFIRLEKNTELFTKGSVFERSGSYYAPLDRNTVYIDQNQRNVSDAYLSLETVQRLGEKVFAPVTKFNPAFVTADEDARLQAVLKAKAPAAKKATVKKATK